MNGTKENERIGYLTEHAVSYLAYSFGVDVSLPTTPIRYDQVWDIGSRILRVQIKHASDIIYNDNIVIGFRFGDEKYAKNEIDGIATEYNNKLYFIPIEKCARENKLYFLIAKGYDNTKWAEDYEVSSLEKLKRILKY